MKKPLVLQADLVGDQLGMTLSTEGYATMLAARERLRQTNPSATFDDVIAEAIEVLIAELTRMN